MAVTYFLTINAASDTITWDVNAPTASDQILGIDASDDIFWKTIGILGVLVIQDAATDDIEWA